MLLNLLILFQKKRICWVLYNGWIQWPLRRSKLSECTAPVSDNLFNLISSQGKVMLKLQYQPPPGSEPDTSGGGEEAGEEEGEGDEEDEEGEEGGEEGGEPGKPGQPKRKKKRR